MSHFADGADVQGELEAFLTAFLDSEAGARAAEAAVAGGQLRGLRLSTVNPSASVWVELEGRRVVAGAPPERGGAGGAGAARDATVELQFDAADLHDLLLNRLGPVEISQLYETDRVAFAGPPQALGALAVLAGQAQPFYPATLAERGRDDLLNTPPHPVAATWEVGGPPPEVIGKRRPWQRPKPAPSSA